MSNGGFADRLTASSYVEDEPIHVFIPGRSDRWVPERLWLRLVNLGRAYEMHLLPLVPGSTEPEFLNAQQVSALSEEVRFLANIVEDELMTTLASDLLPLLAEAEGQTSDHALGIEGP